MSLKFPLVAAVALGLAGCVVHEDVTPPPPDVLNITLDVTFAGAASCFQAGVDQVRATFENNALQAVTVPCNNDQGIAIEYDNVALGTYNVTLEGLSHGTAVYAGNATFTVGDATATEYTFDLPEAANNSTTVTADFTFAGPSGASSGGMTCQQAQVSNVTISVDNGAPTVVPCHDSASNTDSAVLSGISPGLHNFEFTVTDSHGNTLYGSQANNVQINAGSNELGINVLGVTPGSLQLQWVFADGNGCSMDGVAVIEYSLVDPSGRPAKSGQVACADASGNNGNVTIASLGAGIYSLASIDGKDPNGNVIYSSNGSVGGLYVPAGQLQAFQVTLQQAR